MKKTPRTTDDLKQRIQEELTQITREMLRNIISSLKYASTNARIEMDAIKRT